MSKIGVETVVSGKRVKDDYNMKGVYICVYIYISI